MIRDRPERFGDIQAKARHREKRDGNGQQHKRRNQRDYAGAPLFSSVMVTHCVLNPPSSDRAGLAAQSILFDGDPEPGVTVRRSGSWCNLSAGLRVQ